MAVSSTIDQTADEQGNLLANPIHSYDDWESQFSTDSSLDFEEKLPSYIDYLRTSFFERGELTKEVETSLQGFYADQIIGDRQVTDEEYYDIASRSTAFNRTLDDDASLIRALKGEEEAQNYLNSGTAAKLKASNEARESLLATGDIPFASLLQNNMGVVQSGNYLDQGTVGTKRYNAEKAALDSYKKGYLDPRDLWQVSEGLNDSGIGGLTKFQVRQDDELLAALGQTLSDQAKDGETTLNDSISSLVDLDFYRESQVDPEAGMISRGIQEFRAEDPTKIDQVVLNKLPESLDMVQEAIIDRFLDNKNLTGSAAEDQIRGRLREQDTYSKSRVATLIRELAVRHANLQGAFKFFEDPSEDKKNIRVTEMGTVIAHPSLMSQRDRFEKAIESDDRLTEDQKDVVKEQRKIYMQGRVKAMDELFSSFDAVSNKWEEAKSRNPSGFNKEPVAFIDDFLSKSANYDSVKNKIGGVKASVKDALLGMIHAIGAVGFGSETSAEYLVNHQQRESKRNELATLFGKPHGIGYELSTLVAPVVTDLAATSLLTIATGYGGAAYASAKAGAGVTSRATSRGVVKALTGSFYYKQSGMTAKEAAEALATKKLIDKSGVEGATAAIQSFNKIVQGRMAINSSLFLTSANRSAGGMYGTIYSSLPDDMSHEEKHDKALGHSLVAGTVTGLIVAGMSAIGRGGLENILLRDMSYTSMKNILNRIGRVELSDGALKEVLKTHIKKRSNEIIKSKLPTQLFKNAVDEGFEEGLDQFINSFVEDSALDRKTPMREKVMQAFHAAQLGAIMGASAPAAKKGVNLVNKLRGASYVDPDLFRSQEVERAVSALQAAGSPLSAAELRTQFTKAAREVSKPGETPEPKQPLPTTVDPEGETQPEQGPQLELPEDYKSNLLSQLEQFLEDPANTFAPVIEPQFLNAALKDKDLYFSKGGVLLGIRKPDGEWAGKRPESDVDFEPVTPPDAVTPPDTTPDPDQSDPLPEGEELLFRARPEEGGVSPREIDRILGEGLAFINREGDPFAEFSPEELGTREGIRKVFRKFWAQNGERLNKYGVRKQSWKTGGMGIQPRFPSDIIFKYNTESIASRLSKLDFSKRRNDLRIVFAEEMTHVCEALMLADEYRNQSDIASWPDYLAQRASKVLASMNLEQIVEARVEYSSADVGERARKKKDLLEQLKIFDVESLRNDPIKFAKKVSKIVDQDPENLVAEGVRQYIQFRKYATTTESFRRDRPVSKSFVQYVAKIFRVFRQVLDGLGLDTQTQSVFDAYILDVDKKIAEFWEYDFEQSFANNEAEAQVRIERAIETEINSEESEESEKDIEFVSVLETDVDTSIIENSRNSRSELDTSETEQRLASMINTAKYAVGTFGIDIQLDEIPTAERGAFWSEGEQVYVNPYGLHELIDGLRDEDAQSEIEAEIVRQAASVAAYRNISQAEIDQMVQATSDADYLEIVKTLPKQEQSLAQQRLSSPDSSIVAKEKERLVEHRINEFSSRLLRGHTINEDRLFFKGNPGWVGTTSYYLEGVLNRVWAARDARKENPYLTTGIKRTVEELRAMKGRYRLPVREMRFDRNKPESTLLALKDIIDEEESTREALDDRVVTEEPEVPFRIKNVLDTLEVPVYEIGAYKKPPKWISWLAGREDPRLRQLNEMRMQYGRMINKEVREYKEIFDQLIKDTYGSHKLAPAELIAAATGSTRGVLIDDRTRELIDTEYLEAVELINKTYADLPVERNRLIDAADAARNQRVKYEESVKKAQIEKARSDALASIARDSPQLAEHLGMLRNKVDDLSKQIGKMTGDQSVSMQAHIDNQLGIYLTRSYRIFSDENWIDDVLNKEEHRDLRNSVKKEFTEYLIKEKSNSLFENYERLNVEDRESDWNKLSYTSKRQQVMIEATEQIALQQRAFAERGQDFGDAIIEDFLSSYKKGFWDSASSELQNSTIDVLRKKKNLPEFMLKLLGEYKGDTGDFNLMRTFANVGSLASNLAMVTNMVTVGRRGELKDRWFVTKAELDQLRKEDPDKYNEWDLVNRPKKVGHEVGTSRFDPTKDFIDENGESQGPLYADPEFISDYDNLMRFKESISDTQKISEKLDGPLRRLTGMALGAKTLGSIPFFIRNVVSNVLFFGPAQGVMPLGKMFIKGADGRKGSLFEELSRKLTTPEEIDDYSSKLIKLGVLDNELTSSLLEALKKGKYGEEDILGDMNKFLNEAAEAAGIPDFANASEKEKQSFLKKVLKGGGELKAKTWDASVDKLRALSEVVDSFYKIAYFETELDTMRKAREAAKSNDRIANMTDANLEQEAARKVKMTAQSYSQAPPIVAGMQNSVYGVLFAPYFRFKLEVPRIMINTYKLGIEEMKSGNSVIAFRGARRLAGMNTMVVGFSMLAKSLGEKAVVAIINAFGGEAEDDDLTTDQEDIIRMGSPPYLRSHTFYFYKMKDQLYSLDLTYVNPFAMYADSFPRAWEHLRRGDEAAAVSSFIDTLVKVPFLDGQIAFTSLQQAMANQDAEGNPLWLTTDTAYEKIAKGMGHVFAKAYAPPTIERLAKLAAAENASREELFETPYGMLLKELVPFRPYAIDPSQVKYRIMKDLSDDTNILEGDLRSILTGKLLSQDDIEDVAFNQIEGHRRIGETLKRVYTPLRELGVSADEMQEAMQRMMNQEQLDTFVSENAMLLKTITPSMQKILEESEQQDIRERYLTFERTIFDKAPNGKVYLSED